MSRGLLLVRGEAARVAAWARGGLVPVHVATLRDGWVALTPADARATAAAPYDDPVAALVGRPVPRRMRGAVGVAQVGPRLVLTVVPAVLRHTRRWVVWEPGQGLVRVPGLDAGTATDLAAAAGARERAELAARVLHDVRGVAAQVLADTFAALRLPGALLATGQERLADRPDAVTVEPQGQDVQRFDKAAAEDRRWRKEVEDR